MVLTWLGWRKCSHTEIFKDSGQLCRTISLINWPSLAETTADTPQKWNFLSDKAVIYSNTITHSSWLNTATFSYSISQSRGSGSQKGSPGNAPGPRGLSVELTWQVAWLGDPRMASILWWAQQENRAPLGSWTKLPVHRLSRKTYTGLLFFLCDISGLPENKSLKSKTESAGWVL